LRDDQDATDRLFGRQNGHFFPLVLRHSRCRHQPARPAGRCVTRWCSERYSGPCNSTNRRFLIAQLILRSWEVSLQKSHDQHFSAIRDAPTLGVVVIIPRGWRNDTFVRARRPWRRGPLSRSRYSSGRGPAPTGKNTCDLPRNAVSDRSPLGCSRTALFFGGEWCRGAERSFGRGSAKGDTSVLALAVIGPWALRHAGDRRPHLSGRADVAWCPPH
jgi:hypothetical protein